MASGVRTYGYTCGDSQQVYHTSSSYRTVGTTNVSSSHVCVQEEVGAICINTTSLGILDYNMSCHSGDLHPILLRHACITRRSCCAISNALLFILFGTRRSDIYASTIPYHPGRLLRRAGTSHIYICDERLVVLSKIMHCCPRYGSWHNHSPGSEKNNLKKKSNCCMLRRGRGVR